MPASRFAVWVFTVVLAAGSTPALACVMAPPASSAVVAERTRAYQAQLWEQADTVFLSRVSALGRVRLSESNFHGNRATLEPSLALKGESPTRPLDVRHTTLTSCGLIPFLDALDAQEGDWFVTYARNLPDGLSIDATLRLTDVVDAETLRAWRKADPS